MQRIAKLFSDGWNQAVGLAQAFRFQRRKVRANRVAALTPAEPMPWALIDETGDRIFMPEGREQPDFKGH